MDFANDGFPRIEPRFGRRTEAGPRASVQAGDGGVTISTPQELAEYLRGGQGSGGGPLSATSAMRTGTVYGCVRLIVGAVGNMPLDIKRKKDGQRLDATDSQAYELINRRPNRWQKPRQFRRYHQACVLLKGNAYSLKVKSRGRVIELISLDPDRMKVTQNDDLSLNFDYRRRDGSLTRFGQDEIFHLYGLTLDGFTGVTPIKYARESIGLALSMEDHGARMFRNGARVGGTLETANRLSPEAIDRLKTSLEDYRAGGAREGKDLILEEGLKYNRLALSAEDAQWIESRKFSRTDIMMFFGVPPFMLGDTEKSTSWGTGIEQQKDGFIAFTLDDHLVMWEEAVTIDLGDDPSIYARFNRNALNKGNLKDRWEAYTKALQNRVFNPNKVLELEDENPYPGGERYLDPPNTAGTKPGDKTPKEERDDD